LKGEGRYICRDFKVLLTQKMVRGRSGIGGEKEKRGVGRRGHLQFDEEEKKSSGHLLYTEKRGVERASVPQPTAEIRNGKKKMKLKI